MEDTLISVYLLIFILVLSLSLYVANLLEVRKIRIIPEVGAIALVGMLIKGIILFSLYISKHRYEGFDENQIGFSTKLFFLGFLPPIIFNSGYHLKRRLFYENFVGIMALAILGTILSIIIVSFGLYFIFKRLGILFTFMECLSFAALISSTDPVSTLAIFSSLKVECNLFYLVFGESCLNDAIAITIFKVANRFIGQDMTQTDIINCIITFIIVFIGYVCGIITALIYKYDNFKNQLMLTVGFFTCTVYIPYLLSEALQLSGIVTILFTGIASRRYTNKNISREAKRYASFVFQLLSRLAETSCFAFLGLSVFSLPKDSFKLDVISLTLLLCYISRALHVYPLLSSVNFYRWIRFKLRQESTHNPQLMNKSEASSNSYSLNTMHAVFFSGLRGAGKFILIFISLSLYSHIILVAFACAYAFPTENRNLVMCTTTVIILITIFIQGSLTESFVKMLGISMNVDAGKVLADLDYGIDNKGHDFERKYLYPLICFNRNHEARPKHLKSMEVDQSSGGGSQTYFDENDDESIESKSLESGSKIKKLNKFPSTRKEFFMLKNNCDQFSPLTIELEEELFRLTRENLQDYDGENEADDNNNPWDYGKY